MSTQKQELYDVVESLPEELANKVIDYIEYVKFSYVMSKGKSPADLIIKSKKDLVEKLEDGERDIENGDVYSVKEVFAEVNEILAN